MGKWSTFACMIYWYLNGAEEAVGFIHRWVSADLAAPRRGRHVMAEAGLQFQMKGNSRVLTNNKALENSLEEVKEFGSLR